MYVHSVKLVNYKSFGDYPENEVILEPRITAIIGKNESGKSNLIDGLSRIRFKGKNSAAFSESLANRNSPSGTENYFIITLKALQKDDEYGITEDTTIEIRKNSYVATGGLLTYYLQRIHPDVLILLELLGKVNSNLFALKDQEWTNYQEYYRELAEETKVDIPKRTAAITFIQSRIGKGPAEKRDQLRQVIESIQARWNAMTNMLPVFFYRRQDKHLLSSYKYEDINKELENPSSNPNSMLNDFIMILGVTPQDFLEAARTGTTPVQESKRNRIRRLISEKINQRFKDIYQAEEIDNTGVEAGGEYLHQEMLFELGRQYCYIKDVTQEEIDSKAYKKVPFMIEDLVGRQEIERFCEESGVSKDLGKTLTAKLMCNAIESGSFELCKASIENFKKLFERILSITL